MFNLAKVYVKSALIREAGRGGIGLRGRAELRRKLDAYEDNITRDALEAFRARMAGDELIEDPNEPDQDGPWLRLFKYIVENQLAREFLAFLAQWAIEYLPLILAMFAAEEEQELSG